MPNNSQNTYWFKRKAYGWGWYPASWQAWVILLFYVLILALNSYRLDSELLTAPQVMLTILPSSIVLTAVLIVICYQTGESPIWQWGEKTKPATTVSPEKSVVKKSSLKKKKSR